MKPFLVRARIPDLGPGAHGAIALYVALYDTEEGALAAVKELAPKSWVVEDIVGLTKDTVVRRRGWLPDQLNCFRRCHT